MIINPEQFKKQLTLRQAEVLQLMCMGYTRKQIAYALTPSVCVQAVHQIVIRIRRRLIIKGSVPTWAVTMKVRQNEQQQI